MPNKPKILFVCLGNICRSPAAQGVFESLLKERGLEKDFEVDSAGIGNWHAGQLPDPRMRAHAIRRGLQLTHHARQVKPYDFDDFDLIVAMDNSNVADLMEIAPSPEAQRKIVRMADFLRHHSHYRSIPDPYYEGAEGFELVLDLLQDGCESLLDELSQNPRK